MGLYIIYIYRYHGIIDHPPPADHLIPPGALASVSWGIRCTEPPEIRADPFLAHGGATKIQAAAAVTILVAFGTLW